MGRKGIGKLSLFSIAKTVIVESIKDGEQHGLVMEVPKIEHAIKSGAGRYYPEPLDAAKVSVRQGTLVTLRDLNRSRIPATATALRKKLARRFSIIGSNDFKVFVDGIEVSQKNVKISNMFNLYGILTPGWISKRMPGANYCN
jgi:hypothetical protein